MGNSKELNERSINAGHLIPVLPILPEDVEALRVQEIPLIVNEDNYISEDLVSMGGSNDMTVNGSATEAPFSYSVPTGQILIAGRINGYLEDNANFQNPGFGGIAGALVNGVQININGTEIENWRTNTDIALTCYDIIPGDALALSQKAILFRWTFWKAAEEVEGLTITALQSIQAVMRDNLTTLVAFRMKVQGVLMDEV